MPNNLGVLLRKLKQSGITKGEVAEKVAISPGYLSKLASGKKPLTKQNIDFFNKEYGNLLKEKLTDFDVPDEPVGLDSKVNFAVVSMLFEEVAKLKAKVEMMSISEADSLMNDRTCSIYDETFSKKNNNRSS